MGKREENRDMDGDWQGAMKRGKRRQLDPSGPEAIRPRSAKGRDGAPETARGGQFRATLVAQAHIAEARHADRIQRIETNRDLAANAPLFRPSIDLRRADYACAVSNPSRKENTFFPRSGTL